MKQTSLLCALLVFISSDNLLLIRALSCTYEDSGCFYNVSLRESCQLLENGVTLEGGLVSSDVYQLLKSINDRLSTSFKETKTSSKLQDMLSKLQAEDSNVIDEVHSEGDFVKEIQYQDAAVFALLKSHLKTKSEQLASLHNENKKLHLTQEEVKSESLRRQEIIQQMFDDKQECYNVRSELDKNLTECSKDVVVMRHSLNSISDQLNSERAKNQLQKYQQIGNEKKLENFAWFSNQVFTRLGLDKALILNVKYDTTEDWASALQAAFQMLDSQLSQHSSSSNELKALRDQNQALSQSLRQAESQLTLSNSCLNDVVSLKAKNEQQSKVIQELKEQLADLTYFRAAQDDSGKPVVSVKDSEQAVRTNFCSLEAASSSRNELCWFQRLVSADFNWRVKANKDLLLTRYNRLKDHTCDNHHGKFIFLDLANLVVGQQAKLTSIVLKSNVSQCFSFWYRLFYVFNQGKFYSQVTLLDSETGKPKESLHIWRQNTESSDWQFTQFTIPSHVTRDGYRIELIAEGNGPGYIAIDDISISDTSCY